MKFLCVGDAHLRGTAPSRRIDDFVQVQFEKMRKVRDLALEHDAITLFTGDLCDQSAPSLDVLIRYMRLLFTFPRAVASPPGNHDLYGASLDSIKRSGFGVLVAASAVRELGHTPWVLGRDHDVAIFGHTYMHKDPMPKPSRAHDVNILVTHDMLIQDKLWAEQEDFRYAADFLEDNDGWDLILCGHYHGDFIEKDERGRYIANPGALVRIKASKRDFAMDPGVLLYDTKTLKLERISLGAKPVAQVFDLVGPGQVRDEKVSPLVQEFVASVAARADDAVPSAAALSELIVAHVKQANCRPPVADLVHKFFAEQQS